MRIAVYGLGHLGAPLAAVLGIAGHSVLGIDPAVPAAFPPVPADMSFIVVPTPSLDHGDRRGGFDSTIVESALRNIAKVNEDGHIAVIVSTVSPGTCDRLTWDFPSLNIVYNPTFIALGFVTEGLTRPHLLLIGGAVRESVRAVEELWNGLDGAIDKDWGPYVHVGSFAEIELLKLSLNAALGTKISLANSLGMLFEAWGVDPAVVSVLGHDPRIGEALMRPGGPIGGPCLPRDNAALRFAAAEKDLNLPLSVATDSVNDAVKLRILSRVLDLKPTSVGILGMSYKYGVDVDTGAVGPRLRAALTRHGVTVHTYDELMGGDLDLALGCDVVVVTQPEYRSAALGGGSVVKPVVDLWAS